MWSRRTSIFSAAVLALGLFVMPGQASASTSKCFDVSIQEPFLSISASRRSLTKKLTHTGDSKDSDKTVSNTWDTSYSHVGQGLDHQMYLDNALGIFDSNVDYWRGGSGCVTVNATALEADVTFGRVLWGVCEPTASLQVSFSFKATYHRGDVVPDLRVWPIAAGTLSCGAEPWAYVSGTVGATAEFGIRPYSSRSAFNRYLYLNVYASAEAGLWPFGVVWDWHESLYSGTVISDILYY